LINNGKLDIHYGGNNMARPAQFARDEVLEKAMQAFWDQGYNATSIADLVDKTDLRPGSIYAAFDSKEGLFLAALDHYAEHSVAKIEHVLKGADSPLEGIRIFFRKLGSEAAGERANRSCLLVNTVLEMARQNEAVQKRVNRHLGTIEALFRHALETAQASGELPSDKDPKALATFLMTSIWGLRVLGGTNPAPARTRSVVNQLLTLLE
jgi:TetR/AcrR family transcriptional repressor of nem operon